MTFQLDTSGYVLRPEGGVAWRWTDLTPFQQGYIEGLFADGVETTRETWAARGLPKALGFSDLAPATLGMIIADCNEQAKLYTDRQPDRVDGEIFWDARQNWRLAKTFPPLTVSLSDDGLVYLTEGVK